MSFEETFGSDLGSYVAETTNSGTAAFDGTLGNPLAGCCKMFSSFVSGVYSTSGIVNNSDTHLVAAGEDLYFNARFLTNIDFSSNFLTQVWRVTVDFSDAAALTAFYTGNNLLDGTLDSGWKQFNFDLSTREGKTINLIRFSNLSALPHSTVDGQQVTAYLDSIEFATSTPSTFVTPTRKLAAGRITGAGSIAEGASVDLGNLSAITGALITCYLSAVKGIVFYKDGSDSKARVFNLDNLSITLGASAYTVAASTTPAALIPLSSSKAIAIYDTSAVVLDISGDAITVGTPASLSATGTLFSGCRLSSTKAILAYKDSGLKAVVLDVSGSTITVRTPASAGSAGTPLSTTIADVASDVAVIAYNTASNQLYLSALYGITTTFSLGDETLVASDCTGPPSISRLEASSQVAVTYPAAPAAKMVVADCDSSGNLTIGTPLTVAAGSHPAVAGIRTTRAVIARVNEFTLEVSSVTVSGQTATDDNNDATVDDDVATTSYQPGTTPTRAL